MHGIYSLHVHTVTFFSVPLCTETPADYGGISTHLLFEACDKRKCISVAVVNDSIPEGNEYFTAKLGRIANLDPRIILDPNVTRVEKTDDGMQ